MNCSAMKVISDVTGEVTIFCDLSEGHEDLLHWDQFNGLFWQEGFSDVPAVLSRNIPDKWIHKGIPEERHLWAVA